MSHQQDIFLRITKAQKYIEENLTQPLPLAELAEKANYSPFHFQRIFKSVIGETPKQYIKRLRLEGAAHQIVLHPEFSMLDVAFQFGFTSIQAFSRAFKNYYQVSPDEFRKSTEENKLIIIQQKNKAYLNPHVIQPESYLSKSIDNEAEELAVEVVNWPITRVIYIPITLKDLETLIGSYRRLKHWAAARNLIRNHTKTLGLMIDYPMFTALEKCRYYACITVDHKPELNGEIHYLEIPPRIYASFKVNGGINELVKNATQFSHQWLPNSGYQINHVPAILEPDTDPLEIHPHENTYQFYLGLKNRRDY